MAGAPPGTLYTKASPSVGMTDRNYRQHLARAAGEQARHVGAKIRELRKARGLNGKELAERAGIMPQELLRIERGEHDVVLTTRQRRLAATVCSLRGVVAGDEASAAPHHIPAG